MTSSRRKTQRYPCGCCPWNELGRDLNLAGFKPCGDRIFSDLAPRLIFQSGIQALLRKSLSNVSNAKIFFEVPLSSFVLLVRCL